MKLAYCAYDQSGRQVTGTIDCPSADAGSETLRTRGLFVVEIEQAGSGSVRQTIASGRQISFGKSARLKHLAMFTRQLAVLVQSGTPLVDALGALERQVKAGPWRAAICDLRMKVEEGVSMGEAMAAHPQFFDGIYCALVTAGEASGELVMMLERLATLKQKELKVRNSVIGAMVYPALLTVLGAGVFAVLLLFVVPRFGELFTSLGMPLPGSTQTLLAVSEAFRSYWWAMATILFGTILAVKWYLRTPRGKEMWDRAALRLPQVGRIVRSFALARITRLLGVLMEGHVSVTEALDLTGAGAGNVRYRQLIADAKDCVIRGQPISQAFSDTDLVTPSVYEAIRSGERSGQVGGLLQTIANFLDEDNDVIVKTLTSIIEPVILIVLGGLVALVAISMFMPLFDLTSMASGGG